MRHLLHFGAVNRGARVCPNGEALGRHEGGFTPFAFELTGRLREDGEQVLTVMADATRRPDAIPAMSTDWWNYGGIKRDGRVADELGLLVWAELPVYWRIERENPESLANPRQELGERIVRDGNRACVALWSLTNESPPSPARLALVRSLALHGRHGAFDESFTEERQAAVYDAQIAMLRRIPFLAGTSPWILKDFRSPRRALRAARGAGLLQPQGARLRARPPQARLRRAAAVLRPARGRGRPLRAGLTPP